MAELSSTPEQIPSPEAPSNAPERNEGGADLIKKMEGRVGRLDRMSKSKSKSTGSAGDDETQDSALQAAKAAQKSGRMIQIMDKEVNLDIVGAGFFNRQASKVSIVARKNISRAAEWLADLRRAYEAWEHRGPGGSTHLSIVLAVILFWKV